jgi:hypothetical protein
MATGAATKTARTEVDAVIKGGSWPGESFLLGTFVTLPKGVRVTLYVLIATVVLYTQFLLPNLLTGRLVNESDRGVVLPGSVSYWINNHRSFTEIDEKSGAWSLPLFSRLPRSVEVEVKILKAKPQKISIPFSTVLFSRLSADPIEIKAKRLASASDVDAFDLTVMSSQNHSRFASLLPFGNAKAQGTEILTKSPNLTPSPETVLEIVRRLSKSTSVRQQDEIEKVLPHALDQATLLHAIQTEYRIHLPSSVLEQFKTIDQLAAEVAKSAAFQTKVVAMLSSVLPRYQQKRDIWAGSRSAPADRLSTFFDLQTSVPQTEKISAPIAFFDASLLGSGSEGMLFGKTGVYYRTDWTVSSGPRNGFIPYADFPSRQFKKSGFQQISLDRGQNFVTAGSGVSIERLIELLTEIQKVVIAAEQR